ncbi:MAG: biotin--[acetyl-CoA-carboxylase] ligase [Oscillospiraceae bacterium]|jgi:BirA family biotin operon repressor/biotin-[acetyl-CoA-carboxylase] ligase
MSKERVYTLLNQHTDGYLSGEEISQQLGISRAAIWKAVDALRKEGYTIEAQSGQGYRLLATPEHLCEREIRSYLPATTRVGGTILCFDTINSTNTYCRQHESMPDGTVVISSQQTAGKGRMGRSFQSTDAGVFLSVLIKPDLSPASVMCITALCGVAVCNTIETVCRIRPQIKWTNDIVLNGKKICGILTELSLESESGALQSLVMGIGINVNQQASDFQEEVRKVATSLSMELGHPVSRPQIAAALIVELDRLYASLLQNDTSTYLETYRRDCLTLGKEVQILRRGTAEPAFAMDIDDDFGLVVQHKDGAVETVRSGEVSVRGLYGYLPD